jgi:predicted small integral membrane protein
MVSVQKQKAPVENPDEYSAQKIALIMFGTLANTTWRLFLPTIGGTVLGIWADKTWDTVPLCTIIGVSLGTIGSIMLIYMQLRQVKNTKPSKTTSDNKEQRQ